jgi:DNA-binding beta-propeller fold protein YncE
MSDNGQPRAMVRSPQHRHDFGCPAAGPRASRSLRKRTPILQEEVDVRQQSRRNTERAGYARNRSAGRRASLLFALALTPWIASADVSVDLKGTTTIASGLANPRGIAFAPNGALYVAENGKGGPGPCIPSPPNPSIDRCYGETGALTQILPDGGLKRILTGLPSLALPDGTAEGGIADVSFFGMTAFVTMGLGGDPKPVRAALGGKASLFGKLLRVTPAGKYQVVSDVAALEARLNPSGGAIDSNPQGALALPGRTIVADAGANALFVIPAHGRGQLFAVIPRLPGLPPFPPAVGRESVPTAVAAGPDGAIYVSQLTSFPFWEGTSSVLRISSDGGSITTFASGFTAVVDLAFDAGGALYVLEIASGHSGAFPPFNPGLGAGRLKRKCPGADPTLLLDGLTYAAGVAIGPDGAAYITNYGTSPTKGEVLRLPVEPCA